MTDVTRRDVTRSGETGNGVTAARHPIEAESYRRLADRVDLTGLGPRAREVVARVIHASADLEYAQSMVVDEAAVLAGMSALQEGAPVIADVEMVRHGLTGFHATCCLDQARPAPGGSPTRSALGMRLAASLHPVGAVVVVGCAPTALVEALELTAAGDLSPSLVIGLPVGFVGAAEAKEMARRSGIPSITNVGDKGGSAVAAAAFNAIARLAMETMGEPSPSVWDEAE